MLGKIPNDEDNDDHCEHYGANNDDEVQDFSLQRSQAALRSVRHLRDLAKDGIVSCGNNNTHAAARYTVCSLKTNALRLQVVVVRAVYGSLEWK